MPLDLLVCSTFGGLTVLSVREPSKPQLRQGNRTVVLSQSLGYLWFYFNKEGPIDRSPAESLYHILNLDFSPRLSYGVSVHSSDNKLNFNVLTFIINAKLSLTLCFCLYCSNSWTNDIFLQFISKHKTLLSRCSWVQSAFRIKNALNAMKGKTSGFRLFLYRRYSLLYSYLWLTLVNQSQRHSENEEKKTLLINMISQRQLS